MDAHVALPIIPNVKDPESDRLQYEFSAGVAKAVLSGKRVDLEAMEMLANALTRLGRHYEALEIDRSIIRLEPESNVAHYNLACSLANLRLVDQAFEALAKAVELGYSDLRTMIKDPDLEGLRVDERFNTLLRRIRKGGLVPREGE